MVRRVPARADADQQDPAAGEPVGSALGRAGIGEDPAQLAGLRLHGLSHRAHGIENVNIRSASIRQYIAPDSSMSAHDSP